MGIAPDSILGHAVDVVESNISRMNSMADEYSAKLTSALNQIAGIKVAAIAGPPALSVPTLPTPSISLDGVPVFTPATLVMPAEPAAVTIDDLLAGLDLGDLDAIPAAPVFAAINIPEAPNMAVITPPTKPTIDTNITIPDAPTITLPDMETLTQITLPDFQFPVLPTFDGVPPSLSGVTVPDVFINWAEPVYESELLDDLEAQVKRMMAGGTGLPPVVEDALFARARQRDSAESKRTLQEAVDTWAARDFSMPPGMLVKQTDVILEQGRLKAAETNRDILLEAAKWEIENLRFAVQQGMALEQLTQNLFENTAKRMFEVAKYQAEAQISVFNAQIGLFNAQNAAFETLAQVYKTKLDAAIAQLTAYKTAVEGQVAVGQINQQRVEVFKARLSAVESNVELYKALMQGASVRADTIKNQFDAYRADVQAYSEQIAAEKVKFDAYESRVKGESAKAGVYDAQARAYASTVQAVASKADIKVKEAQAKTDVAKARIQKFLGDVDMYKAQADVNLRVVQNATMTYQAEVEAWRAKANVAVSEAEVEARFADMTARTNIAYAEMQVSQYTAQVQRAIQQAQIALEAAKALGAYTAQLAAGAMSAAHVSASIGGSGSANSSDSRSTSTSTSYNYSY